MWNMSVSGDCLAELITSRVSSRRRLHLPTGLMVLLRLLSPMQLRVHCHGSPGPAADGLSLPEHQPVCGELSEDGAQAARVR